MALSSLLVKGKNQAVKLINANGIVIFTCKSATSTTLAMDNLTACQIDSQDSLNWGAISTKTGTHRWVLSRNGKRIGATKGSKDSGQSAVYKGETVSGIQSVTPINY